MCYDINQFGRRIQLHRTKDAWKHLAALQRKKKKKNRAKSWTESQDFPRCFKVVPGNAGYNLKIRDFLDFFLNKLLLYIYYLVSSMCLS